MAKTITVFTTSTCAFCVQVKKWLTAKKLTYTEVNLDEHPERRDELLRLSNQMAVPVTVVADADTAQQEVIVGWNLAKLTTATKDMISQPAEV